MPPTPGATTRKFLWIMYAAETKPPATPLATFWRTAKERRKKTDDEQRVGKFIIVSLWATLSRCSNSPNFPRVIKLLLKLLRIHELTPRERIDISFPSYVSRNDIFRLDRADRKTIESQNWIPCSISLLRDLWPFVSDVRRGSNLWWNEQFLMLFSPSLSLSRLQPRKNASRYGLFIKRSAGSFRQANLDPVRGKNFFHSN